MPGITIKIQKKVKMIEFSEGGLKNRTTSTKSKLLIELWEQLKNVDSEILQTLVVTFGDASNSDSLEFSSPEWLISIEIVSDGGLNWFARQRNTWRYDGCDSPRYTVNEIITAVAPWIEEMSNSIKCEEGSANNLIPNQEQKAITEGTKIK